MKTLKFNAKAAVAVVVAMASFIGFNSFKNAEKKVSSSWYQITTNASNPSDDVLGSAITDPTLSGQCNATPDDMRCARFIENPDNHDLSGLTVDEESQLSNVQITSDLTYKPEQ
ncbi:hypothetical protein [Sphingobacterium zeae]|uniref:hypothetical protein n=1 Tax=Sphingobacterium zeae TaxID=1776859 RepID=UPI0036189727